ncbi:MAG: DUF503 domain-containing protein [Defluviitaleaceae bacterium]|nr:DUF503 domain-containing protein [Defluviitaleaceae bacterium]
MHTAQAKLTLHIPHATSLKDKRQIRRSLIEKTRSKFNAAIAEVATQDSHKTLTIGLATVSGEASHATASLDEIIRSIELWAENLGAQLEEIHEL